MRARAGSLEAYGRLIEATQRMAYAVAIGVAATGCRDRLRRHLCGRARAAPRGRASHPAVRPHTAAAADRALRGAANPHLDRRQSLPARHARYHASRGVPSERGVLHGPADTPRSLARHRAGAAVDGSPDAGTIAQDRADGVSDVQPGVGARSGAGRSVVRGARVGRVQRSHRAARRGRSGRRPAVGIGQGLERLAMLCYGIDDIRKIEAARVA